MFQPISLLDVDGKIFMGIFAARMASFLLANGYIGTSVQKAGIPGSPGCVKHSAMIWHTIHSAKASKKDLSVIWLDLANAYGSVPHVLIKYSLEFFHVPEKLKLYLMQYYDGFRMRFTTRSYKLDGRSWRLGFQWAAQSHLSSLPWPWR